MSRLVCVFVLGVTAGVCFEGFAAEAGNGFLGYWALTIPGGGAGWLGVTQENGYLDGSILWGGGSVVPVANVYIDGNTLCVTRLREIERKDASGNVVRKQTLTETIQTTVKGESMRLKRTAPRENGKGVIEEEFTGKRIPPLPPKPDLSKVTFGDPIVLFNGRNLDGWTLTESGDVNGWSAQDGLLINQPVQQEGKPHVSYGNLRTVQEFEDFTLSLEVRVPEKGNSGVYLRGIYEVQVEDSYGEPPDPHHMGGIYSRIKPSVAAEKPAGEWQTLDITLVDRHVTVILNGAKIIDNEPLLGCTGGALWSDEFKLGPIYLQGDHTGVDYRNIVLKPVMK
jgi:hypothetical protein